MNKKKESFIVVEEADHALILFMMVPILLPLVLVYLTFKYPTYIMYIAVVAAEEGIFVYALGAIFNMYTRSKKIIVQTTHEKKP